MITIETTKSGHAVLKKNGRFLGSSYDPVKEAADWAEKTSAGLGSRDRIVVLGHGSGHHVMALGRLRPAGSVLVIEKDARVAELAFRVCPDLSKESLVIEPEWIKLVEDDRIRAVLNGTYRVATHVPSLQSESDYFRKVESLLVGRDKTSFLLQLKTRPDLFEILDPSALEALSTETIGIKTLQKLFAGSPNLSEERRLWRVLEELVV